ncbi:MAG: recombinase RecA [Candidatus Pacebacteria bacterium]|nr:recombinase RecA [Candidatus Paceibacterota bacterium]
MAKQKKIADKSVFSIKASSTDKQSGLDEALEEIKQRFGDGAIMQLSSVRAVHVDSVPTGSLAVDLALGTGGVPRGRIIEIFGGESSGKTTLALHVLAEAQKKGGTCAFVDAEHAMDPDYAKKIGVDVANLLISQPDSGEQALQIVETLVRSKAIDVIVVDSVAALTPKAEIEGEIGDQHIGRQARLMSQAMRKLAGIIDQTKTIVIFLNQTRMKIGIMFGNPETTPGGMALKFYASVRINLTRTAQIKKGEDIVGSRIKVKIVKNKVAAPFKASEFDIYYNEGISKAADLLNTGVKYDVVKKAGSWFQFGDTKLGQGVDGVKEFLKTNRKIEDEIKKAILVKAKEGVQ